jgi:hypothetical protein
MKKQFHILIAGLISGLMLLLAISGAKSLFAQESDWPMAESVTTLTTDPNMEQRSALALASSTRMAALWSEAGAGAKACIYDSNDWSQPEILKATGINIYWPTLAYSGTEALAAWVEVEESTKKPNPIVQMDISTRHTETVASGVIGSSAPDMVIGSQKAHLVFASAQGNNNELFTDIYYTTRDLDETTWASPTKIITHEQVIPAGRGGGIIFYPQIALSPDGQTVHVVWEQGYDALYWEVWYIAGSQSPEGKIQWDTDTIQRVSPADELGSLPDLVVDAKDQVHVAWMRPEPYRKEHADQDIYYRRLGTSEDTIQRLNNQTLRVNDNFPGLVRLSMAGAGEDICVAWHGHHGAPESSETEDIWMRCSPNAGDSWQPVINVSGSPDEHSLFSNIQLDAQGSAYATWVEYKIEGSTKLPQSLNVRTGPATLNQVFLPVVMRGNR